ncbi:MAG: DNA mismatch repair endonuclease MutL [Bacteroidetes bacterium]|nr:DNA mismatch repair endonuclease MutL [Rhodothermia bacterium]MCS7155288.1 DNA mismatch repair endonuclease MutL [Bacteroidota bacterium]MCX7907873.1 DNA mismatch repair endonuclease MutL [Bacteroidota bacterium]MDW8138692.1 DNA mismatch repair endonuclease MutL [Bacteroidota bacterium]MDW8284722.1 DNA mismatch repair endonuclease MutL [Bacteroidota bacterium]
MAGVIRRLPEPLVNQIAAGEVVQRPASVVKELLENAIDAGANRIEVHVRDAGKSLVQVIDNGCGMSAEDAVLCFERHATSKIARLEDLQAISTLGFRGEALASIAAVAQVELRTRRPEDAYGTCVRIEGGRLKGVEACSAPVGTSVSVRNLFYNTPARRRFLKSDATEWRHILNVFRRLALCYSRIAFTLFYQGEPVYVLPPEALLDRLARLLEPSGPEDWVAVREETPYVALQGYVAKPVFSRISRGEPFWFVNGRYVRHRPLDHAVYSAYGELIPRESHPPFVLFLTLDPRHVDVNVHPTKEEVKFDDEPALHAVVRAAVRRALGEARVVPEAVWYGARLVERTGPPPKTEFGTGPSGSALPKTALMPQGVLRPLSAPYSEACRDSAEGDRASAKPEKPLEPKEAWDPLQEARLFWQLHNRYILVQIRSGVLIVDQHAAHERVLYEQALHALEGGLPATQQLLFPHTLVLPPEDFELLKELAHDLCRLGFVLKWGAGRQVSLLGVPAEVRPGREQTILQELLARYKRYQHAEVSSSSREALAKALACQMAVKSGDVLSPSEMESLLHHLFACQMPYACPHGRPTIIQLTLEELDRRFGRIGHLERA